MYKFIFFLAFTLLSSNLAWSQNTIENDKATITKAPPPPPLTEAHIKLSKEIDALQEKRTKNINNLVAKITDTCRITDDDYIIIQLTVNPKGEVINHDAYNYTMETSKKVSCLQEALDKTLNLGVLKVIPSAKNGSKAQNILYTLPIKK